MTHIIAEMFKLLFGAVFEALLAWTGEIVLFTVTLGRRKPRWDLYTNESPSRFVIFSEASFWIGAAFWVGAIAAVVKLL